MKKIPTLFNRIFQGHKIIGITEEITPGCEDAFISGVATVKIDGSCCAIIDGVFYKRYDAKRGKAIPEGAIKCQEEADPITGHLPCWIKVNPDNPSDKWFIEALRVETVNFRFRQPDGTYEAIGKHFQGNPYSMNYDTLERHGDLPIYDLERTFEGVQRWLKTHTVEGIVFWLDNKPVCKIKRSDFGLEWPLKEDKDNDI